MTVAEPTLEVERSLHDAGARYVIGLDEVGRGAIAGPVAVGLAVVERGVGDHPAGLRDSKLLSEPRREALAPLASNWALHSAVGLASATEVDELGIMAALSLAARRAVEQVALEILAQSVLLLDGNHDYVRGGHRVVTRVKGDRDCSSVAAASVIAKVHRDRIMIDAHEGEPGYGWAKNKGYASAAHYAAIRSLGPSALHRRTWLHQLEQPTLDLGDAAYE